MSIPGGVVLLILGVIVVIFSQQVGRRLFFAGAVSVIERSTLECHQDKDGGGGCLLRFGGDTKQ
jgi:hypothetical protein